MNIFWKSVDTVAGLISYAAEYVRSTPSEDVQYEEDRVQAAAGEVISAAVPAPPEPEALAAQQAEVSANALRQSLQEFTEYQKQVLKTFTNLNSINEITETYIEYIKAANEKRNELAAAGVSPDDELEELNQFNELDQAIVAAKTTTIFQARIQDTFVTLQQINSATEDTSRIYQNYHARHVSTIQTLERLSNEVDENPSGIKAALTQLDETIQKVSDLKNRNNKTSRISRVWSQISRLWTHEKSLNNQIQEAYDVAVYVINHLNFQVNDLRGRIDSAANLQTPHPPVVQNEPAPVPYDNPAAAVLVQANAGNKPAAEEQEQVVEVREQVAAAQANVANAPSDAAAIRIPTAADHLNFANSKVDPIFEMTKNDKETFDSILNTTNSWRALTSKAYLSGLAKKVAHVHPLTFLVMLTRDPTQKKNVDQILDTPLIGYSFIEGFAATGDKGLRHKFEDALKNNNLTPAWVKGFAEATGLDQAKVQEFIDQQKWRELVEFVIGKKRK